MKHHHNHKIFTHNWFLNPLLGVSRTKLVKNEAGEDEPVFVTAVEKRDQTLINPNHVDLLPYFKTRAMLCGNKNTTSVLLEQALKTYSAYSKKKNVGLNFEQSLRVALPLLGTKTIARTAMGSTNDVTAFNEKQASSLLSKWFLDSIRGSTKNLPHKSGKALGNEVFITGLLKNNSSVLKKRTAFYNEVWNLYTFDEEEGPKN